jgi:DNA-binding winged helix-turn-helix (wHTH) protein/tetratricopeptide (TPR) repeat protein/TolB-like protein
VLLAARNGILKLKIGSRRAEVTNERRRFHEIVTPPPVAPPERLAFGPFVLEPETGRLFRGDQAIPLAPKPFETLLYLARRPGRVVSKTELIEALWRDTYVTEDVLVQSMVEVRRALGDPAKTPRYIQTLPRRGYQFIETVRDLIDGPPAPGPALADAPPTPPPAPPAGGAPLAAAPAVRAGTTAGRRRAAGALVVLSLAAGAAWFVSRRATPEAAPADPPERGSLLVMPVQVQEPEAQSQWLRQGLAEMIQSQLGQNPGVRVVARHRLAAALGGAESDAAAEIARRLRAETLVTGSFVRVESDFVLSAQVVEVSGGRTRGTASVRGRYPGDLLDAVDDLCLRLVPFIGGDAGGGGPFRPTGLATRSFDASRHYVEALGWFARGGRRGAEEAEKRLDEALRLDGSFAQAYLKKAEIQQWRRTWGYGDPDPVPALEAAARLARDLPERERRQVESFRALIVQHAPSRALEVWDALLRTYPSYAIEAGVPVLMAETLQREGRWDEAIRVGEAHVESASLPDGERARLSSLLARAFRRKGEFARGLQHARRAVRLWPSPNGPEFLWQRSQLGRISLEAGRRDEALQEFRAVASAPDVEARNLADAAWGLYMVGESDEARALVERALRLDPGYGNSHHLRGWLLLAAGEHVAAARSLEMAFDKTPPDFGNPYQGLVNGDLAALYYAGVAWQKAGRAREARAAFERLIASAGVQAPAGAHARNAAAWQAHNFRARALARLGQKTPEPERLEGDDTTWYVQSARLHAVQGQLQRALDELARGLALGHGEQRHIRDDPDFEGLRADPEFLRLVTPEATPARR